VRIKRYGFRFLLIPGSFFLALINCEVALRIAGWSAPIFTIPDSQLGVRLLPNAEGWRRDEGTTYLRINSAGFRDREHQKQKLPGTFRIAVLGDSYAEARQVSMDDTFWAILEKKLQSCQNLKGKQVEVLNFGVKRSAHGAVINSRRTMNHVKILQLLYKAIPRGASACSNSA